MVFAEKHELIPAGALKEAKQVANAIKAGATMPGGCKDKDSCSSYCSASNHAEECLGFAEKAGFVSAEEATLARKVLPLINAGQSPGGCKTKDECQKYCNNDSNTTECLIFAEKAGLISSEDAALAKKVGGKGPGGCKSKETCAAYCNDIANQEACFQFAKQYDIIPVDKLKQKIVAHIGYHFKKSGRDRHVIDLGWIVHPDYEGQGIGSKMLKSILEDAKKRGFKRAEAEMAIKNIGSWKIALKNGFKIEGIKKKALLTDDGEYIDTYIVGKIL